LALVALVAQVLVIIMGQMVMIQFFRQLQALKAAAVLPIQVVATEIMEGREAAEVVILQAQVEQGLLIKVLMVAVIQL
jgi:hypothetical protein